MERAATAALLPLYPTQKSYLYTNCPMTKSTIIIIVAIWLLCTIYFSVATVFHYPYAHAAKVGTWVASGLLLICIVLYINKHKDSMK